MKVNLTKKVSLTKREGRHRRSTDHYEVRSQILVFQDKVWRWSEAWDAWLGARVDDDTRVARRRTMAHN